MKLEKETFLRVLKGAPLSVLLCLWVHGAMGKKGIVRKTGWHKDTVEDALAFLMDMGLVSRPHYRKWVLADGFYQLPFPSLAERPQNRLSGGSEQLTLDIGPVDKDEVGIAERPQNRLSEGGNGPENPQKRLSLTTTTSNDLSSSSDSEKGVVVGLESDCETVKELLHFGGVGLGTPAMNKLLAMGLDVDFVRAHVYERLATVRKADGSGNWYRAGLLIRRLESGDLAPAMRCGGCVQVRPHCRCGVTINR
jgi:hypothetical protein